MYTVGSMEEGEDLGTWLGLGIGGSCDHGDRRRPSPVQLGAAFRQHAVKEETVAARCNDHDDEQAAGSKNKGEKGARRRMRNGTYDNLSRVPSLSDGGGVGGGGDSGGGTARKKLQLTKEQSTLLEDSFRAHNILSHAQKHELARQLKLKPRQVEVWFQNRRARTKLKQTEVDCEFLKRCCKSLTDENQRLKNELMELQRLQAAAAKAGAQLYLQLPRTTAMVNVCPSCEKIAVTTAGGETGKSSSYSSFN